MVRFGRYNLTEISLNRLLSAIKARTVELPHTFAWKFSASARENRERMKKYRDFHRGDRCFVIANGPSLIKTNLNLIKNNYSFGMNRIYLHFEQSSFRPTYYVAVNELVLEQFSNDISRLEMPKFINWNQRSSFDSHNPNCLYLKSKFVVRDYFQDNLIQPLSFGGTVTFVALQIAYYMGFQQVILVGLDHKYAEKGTPNKTEKRQADHDVSHFHPDYFPQGVMWQLPDLLRSEISYKIARDAYESAGRQILDATVEGNCKVFEKVDYLSLFN
jgi:6-hydroxymethylpterin diphosphokinase MptE-like